MSCNPNVIKGKELVLLARNDGDTEWEIIGGAKTRGATFDNPVEDVTSASTPGDFSEGEWTGYSNVSLNISGVADQRTGVTVGDFNVVGASRLQALATSGTRCGKFRLLNTVTNGYVDGFFNITSYSTSGDTPGLQNYDATLENKETINVVGDL